MQMMAWYWIWMSSADGWRGCAGAASFWNRTLGASPWVWVSRTTLLGACVEKLRMMCSRASWNCGSGSHCFIRNWFAWSRSAWSFDRVLTSAVFICDIAYSIFAGSLKFIVFD